MINFGFDILLSIFNLLEQGDKLECMTVCQKWYDIIYTHSLFLHIHIENQNQLDQLMQSIEKNPAVGEKVEQLVLETMSDSGFDYNIFTEIFPNLRYYALQSTSSLTRVEPYQNHPWCRHMKQINGMESTVKALLVSSLCKNLTYISVQGRNESTRNLIEQLTNAPTLKILNMNNFRASLEDLELLHNTVPHLDSLGLSSIRFDFNASPLGIISATSVKNLSCSELTFELPYQSSVFLLYIIQKYTHVEELSLDCCFPLYFSGSEQGRSAVSSYIKTLGPRLKSLLFVFDWERLELYEVFDFDIMDAGGFQVEKLNLGSCVGLPTLRWLAETTQAQYLRSLTVSGIDYIQTMETIPFSFSWITRFKSLKELDLSSYRTYYYSNTLILNLNDMLENLCETCLECLKLRDVHLQLNNSSRIPVYPSLKSLTICDSTFDTGIDAFVSSAFPNLKHLALKFLLGLKESFSFPNLDLYYLEMMNSTENETFPVVVITLADGKRRFYNGLTKNSSFRYDKTYPLENCLHFPSACCQTFDKFDITPILTITCHSVYDFHLFIRKSEGDDIPLL